VGFPAGEATQGELQGEYSLIDCIVLYCSIQLYTVQVQVGLINLLCLLSTIHPLLTTYIIMYIALNCVIVVKLRLYIYNRYSSHSSISCMGESKILVFSFVNRPSLTTAYYIFYVVFTIFIFIYSMLMRLFSEVFGD